MGCGRVQQTAISWSSPLLLPAWSTVCTSYFAGTLKKGVGWETTQHISLEQPVSGGCTRSVTPCTTGTLPLCPSPDSVKVRHAHVRLIFLSKEAPLFL